MDAAAKMIGERLRKLFGAVTRRRMGWSLIDAFSRLEEQEEAREDRDAAASDEPGSTAPGANNKTEQPRERFDPLARPLDWYRLPLAIKLAVINLWRVEQEQDPATQTRSSEEGVALKPLQPGDVRRSTYYYDDGMLPWVAVIVLIVVVALAVFYLNL